jgi:purine-nucleoside phosphorylase
VPTHPATILANEQAMESAIALADITGVGKHDVAVVLGSGWMSDADLLGRTVADFPVTNLPHFRAPVAEGHLGRFRSVDIAGERVLIFLGRTHLYEELGVDAATHSVRTASAAGCRSILLTNGCGGLNTDWTPGTPVLISDHINLTGTTPLHGAHFVDLTDLYSKRLRGICRQIEPSLEEGVYAQFRGPMYETPAEVRMAGILGADLVGMSTGHEAIVARSLGMEVLGLSLVTNLAAGLSGHPLSHGEVLAAGRASAARMADLMTRIIPQM